MTKDVKIDYIIPSFWDNIRQIRNKVVDSFEKGEEEICNSCLIVITELVENAMKYGESDIVFNFVSNNEKVVIEVENIVHSSSELKNLNHHIYEIESSSSPEDLYLEKLKNLVKNHTEQVGDSHGLGLYRIAAECKFHLITKYHDGKLTISATRNL